MYESVLQIVKYYPDARQEILREAGKVGFDIVISPHPLWFHRRPRLRGFFQNFSPGLLLIRKYGYEKSKLSANILIARLKSYIGRIAVRSNKFIV